jgi:uncharacterized protein YggE
VTGLAKTAEAASAACDGTQLELSVREQEASPAVRFRFSLAVRGEGRSEKAAMQQLNHRLGRLRRELGPLLQGKLTVSAPTNYPHGSGVEKRFVASAAVSADVTPANFNPLIQTVGVMPGVRQQGVRSMADEAATRKLQQNLMAKALLRGTSEAEATAEVIGLNQVRIISIQRGDSIQSPRPMLMKSSAEGFDPQQAPSPRTSVGLRLVYCLS